MDAQRYVGEILVRRGALPAERLEELLRTAGEKDVSLLDLLNANREAWKVPLGFERYIGRGTG